MSGIPLLDEKCIGAFVASAIGDALGWPNEPRSSNREKVTKPLSCFIDWKRRSGGRYWSHTEKILAGEYSDDTQLILAVARSLLSGKKWNNHFSSIELPFWLDYERGGGTAIIRAARSWKNKIEPWNDNAKNYFYAGGNGAAMRILPHVIFGIKSDTFDNIANDVALNAIITHGHPRAILGALLYAYALFYLIKKENTLSYGELIDAVRDAKLEWSKFPSALSANWIEIANKSYRYIEVWNNTVESILRDLNMVSTAINKGALDLESETLTALKCFDKNVNGAGDIAAIASVYLASKYANNPILGIKSAANAIGSDTDTIASMTGGLLGTICGMEWIPTEWKLVQDYDCLVLLARLLLMKNGVEAIKEYVANAKIEMSKWERSSIGMCKVISTNEIPSGKTGTVRITKMSTILGQTLYVKKYFREKKSEEQITLALDQVTNKYSLQIKPDQINSIMNDKDLNSISFFALLKIFELYNHGITDYSLIAQRSGVGIETVYKVISLTIPFSM